VVAPLDLILKKPCPGGCEKFLYERAYYMVKNEVWEAAGFGRGLACLDCLTEKLERKLTPSDFTDAPCNEPIFDVLRNVDGSRPARKRK